MIKVLHIDTGLTFRGGQRQVHLLIDNLRRFEIEQYLACPNESPLISSVGEYIKDHCALSSSNLLRFLRKGQLRRFISENNINLLHAHDSHAHTLATSLASRISSKIMVTRRSSGKIKFGSRTKYNGFGIRYIAISNHVKDMLIDGAIEPGSIRVISSMVDTRLYGKSGIRVKEDKSNRQETPIIVSAGAFDAGKGYLDALAAIGHLARKRRDFRYILYGDGPQKKDIERFIKKENLSDIVSLPGWRDNPPQFLAEADIFLTPSYQEGLNMSLLEAMASSAVVLASDIPPHRENITDGQTGFLFPPGNVEKITERLNLLLDNSDMVEKIGANAAEFAVRFDCRTIAGRTFDYYNEIVG